VRALPGTLRGRPSSGSIRASDGTRGYAQAGGFAAAAIIPEAAIAVATNSSVSGVRMKGTIQKRG
jgi:hypothetical protein